MKTTALLTTDIGSYPKRTGKVREIYELPENLLIIATDRISAFDVVMPNGIPDKGRVLTQISLFWFEQLAGIMPNHIIQATLEELPAPFRKEEFDGRYMLCRRAKVLPVECIVRGYITGSGWKEYQKQGSVCGVNLPDGLKQCQQLPEPIFTPSTKAEQGHDENITFNEACELIGDEKAQAVRDASLALYKAGRDFAAERGVIIADTKFEFGIDESGGLILIDEVLTPDSSRFWPADKYEPGRDQESFDKQFVRNYLEEVKFNKQPPGPMLPKEIVQATREKYIQAYEMLTGKDFAWA